MTIKTKYGIGAKLPVEVDGGAAEGTIVAIAYRLNRDGAEAINYELDAVWHYQGQKYERLILRTEAELVDLSLASKTTKEPK